MSEPRTLYVVVDYKDPEGVMHLRGESVDTTTDNAIADELLYRGILSTAPVRKQAGENSARVTGEPQK